MNTGRAGLQATLHHIGITSPDPAKLADFYHRALGLTFDSHDGRWTGAARDRVLIIKPGARRQLLFAAYAVQDPGQLTALHSRITAAGVTQTANPTHLFHAGAVSVQDPDGNHYVFGMPARQPALPSTRTAQRLARLQHVVVASTDAERVATFFRDVLGFTASDNVVDVEGRLRTCFLRCSDEHHNFAVFQAAETSFDHHCYEAGDWSLIRDWGDHLAAERIPIEWGPGRHGPGNNLFLFVHDTDGNWVELSAELEVVRPDRPAGSWRHEERTLNSWGQAPLRS